MSSSRTVSCTATPLSSIVKTCRSSSRGISSTGLTPAPLAGSFAVSASACSSASDDDAGGAGAGSAASTAAQRTIANGVTGLAFMVRRPASGGGSGGIKKRMKVLHVVLVEPEIHWNTGNAGRTCLAADAQLHLVAPLGFSLDDKNVRRAGL